MRIQRPRSLEWLDNRTMELSRFDQAVRLGRIEGETKGMLRMMGKPMKYERTPESRLQKHYEREYNRKVKQKYFR